MINSCKYEKWKSHSVAVLTHKFDDTNVSKLGLKVENGSEKNYDACTGNQGTG